MTWGHSFFCGDSNDMQAAFIGVETIYSTATAVGAVLRDGTAVNWCDEGGDSRNMHAALIGVVTSYSRSRALAAVLKDGTLVIGGQVVRMLTVRMYRRR